MSKEQFTSPSLEAEIPWSGCWYGWVLLLQTADFLLYLYMGEREGALVPLSPYKGTSPIMGAPLSWPHLNLSNTKAPLPNTIALGVKTSAYELRGDTST